MSFVIRFMSHFDPSARLIDLSAGEDRNPYEAEARYFSDPRLRGVYPAKAVSLRTKDKIRRKLLIVFHHM